MDEKNNLDKIEENLWLGNYRAAKDIKDLKTKGITKILSIVDRNVPDYNNEDGFIHKKFKVPDFSSKNIIQYFGECLNFIKGDEKVLVHCISGSSRSASIVIAYIMWIKKMKYEDAFKFVKDKRKCVNPNIGFIAQLKIFENLLEKNEYNLDKINFKDIKV